MNKKLNQLKQELKDRYDIEISLCELEEVHEFYTAFLIDLIKGEL